jgi:hypothetical protein
MTVSINGLDVLDAQQDETGGCETALRWRRSTHFNVEVKGIGFGILVEVGLVHFVVIQQFAILCGAIESSARKHCIFGQQRQRGMR